MQRPLCLRKHAPHNIHAWISFSYFDFWQTSVLLVMGEVNDFHFTITIFTFCVGRVCVCSVSCFTSLLARRRGRAGTTPSLSAPPLPARWLPWRTRLNKVEAKSDYGFISYTNTLMVVKTDVVCSIYMFLIVLFSCRHSCSLHHNAAAGQLCRCVDWSAGWGHHEMDQWEIRQLHQLVSNWTKELLHRKLAWQRL